MLASVDTVLCYSKYLLTLLIYLVELPKDVNIVIEMMLPRVLFSLVLTGNTWLIWLEGQDAYVSLIRCSMVHLLF
nr:hypothetical protein Iba_chr10dCG0770 [Ipomoea batatas]